MEEGIATYQQFLEGDIDVLEDIVAQYKDGLILYLIRFVNDIYIAEELAEDVFVKLVLKKPRFSQRAAFKTWLYAIGRNVALDYLRWRKRQPFSIEEHAVDGEEASLEESYIQQDYIKRLKPEYAQVLWLAYFEGFSYQQIGRIMKKSTHSTETLAYRARLALKQILIKEGFEYEDQ